MGATVLYDCYLYIVYLFGLEGFFRDIPMRAIEFPLWGILGILLWIRYYKCKKTITQDFDMAYKEWHPDKREFGRIMAIVILVAPFIILFFI